MPYTDYISNKIATQTADFAAIKRHNLINFNLPSTSKQDFAWFALFFFSRLGKKESINIMHCGEEYHFKNAIMDFGWSIANIVTAPALLIMKASEQVAQTKSWGAKSLIIASAIVDAVFIFVASIIAVVTRALWSIFSPALEKILPVTAHPNFLFTKFMHDSGNAKAMDPNSVVTEATPLTAGAH